jgi:hypothetical protein
MSSIPLLIQGLQARVAAVEGQSKRCDHGVRLDTLERNMINMNNSMDVLRMATGGGKVHAPSTLDNAVIASLRGTVDALCKRELEREVSLQGVAASVDNLHVTMLSLESSLSSGVVDGKVDVVREEEQVRDTRDIAIVSCTTAQQSLMAEMTNLRAALDTVAKAALLHSRAGRADIEALKLEIRNLKEARVE